ncbi:MAG: 16S rRNA (adenine(1518)-N(6)/adenine(1519)-N(6))-dimethyltransferase RsmA [Legionellaceae bacterium]|nr:16S rRNA (adenine(1518)-N(6)/adenine(1519)-N(6))-dimethyltransferase RsmA [Legionellaceae bacterium]
MTTHRPRKRFGQNFLEDMSIIGHILDAIHPSPHDNMLEIGPGLGALTRPLLKHLNTLTAIEIDTDLQAYLASMPEGKNKLTIISADALTVDLAPLGQKLRVIGNLPYNISTPLLFHLLEHAAQIEDMHFMLQEEVVKRLAAPPNCKAYGRLSVMVQALCHVEALFTVPPTAFNPPPKVQSAIVRITPHVNQPEPDLIEILKPLLHQAFSTRRKTLGNTLKPIMSASKLTELGINPMRRPETLSVQEYLGLAKALQ